MNHLLEGLRIEGRQAAPAAQREHAGRAAAWRRRPRVLAAGIGLTLFAAGTWYALATRPMKIGVSRAEAASSGSGAPVLTAGGYVRAARIVYVAPKVSGRIAELPAKEGDEVAAGQVIAVIETRDLVQETAEAHAHRDVALAVLEKLTAGSRPEEVAESKARLEAARLARGKAEREFARARALFDEGILSAQALDLARTEFQIGDRALASVQQAVALVEAGPRREEIRAARAALRAAEARLQISGNRMSDARLEAPIAGRVVRKFRNVGDFVSPDVPYLEGYETIAVGSPVVALTDLGPQEVSADINETDIGRVALPRGRGAEPGRSRSRGRRLRVAHGAFGFGKDDAPEHRRRARQPDRPGACSSTEPTSRALDDAALCDLADVERRLRLPAVQPAARCSRRPRTSSCRCCSST